LNRLIEILLGLKAGFLSRDGDLTLSFAPKWPWQDVVGVGAWNLLLLLIGAVLVVWVYRREGGSQRTKLTLGVLRGLAILLVLTLLNRPVLTMVQSRVEPSVLPVLVDTSLSMKVRDVGEQGKDVSRLQAVVDLLDKGDNALAKALAKQHQVRVYSFDAGAKPVEQANVGQLKAEGGHTELARSVRDVLEDLRGQRVAGVVVLTDGREAPARPMAEVLAAIKDFGVKVYPVAVGTDASPKNVVVENVTVQDSAFKGDIVNLQATVRATGYPPDLPVKMVLKDQKTGKTLRLLSGTEEETIRLGNDQPQVVELQFKPTEVGTLDLQIEATPQAGELDDADNVRLAQVSVLDAKIAVLYVDGYPRWDYRYIKNEMIRDTTVDISCLLTSADPTFAQEGDKPIRRFPESIQELLEYDVVLFGDVDPRQFSETQLQLVSEFVAKKGGGFGMVAGPRYSPLAFRNTPIEPILPVSLARVQPDEGQPIVQGFRPIVTKLGVSSGIFRFLTDRDANARFLKDEWPPVFWFSKGVAVKAGVGEVYAEHPTEMGPDGRKAPVIVFGRFGAGRTLFSAVDDSWRWRFYTGENVFDTYWVQTFRQLARGRKLGQRRISFASLRPTYEVGSRVHVSLRLLDPQLGQQLPEQIRVDVTDAGNALVRQENLVRQEGQSDLYVATWTADRVGNFVVKLPPIAGGVESIQLPLEVSVPRLELVQPQVDKPMLNRLAAETLGQVVSLDRARELPGLIPSAAKTIPVQAEQQIWDAPIAMIAIVSLLIAEWIARKMKGLV
jgi:uncharacterized membrane protein